MPATAACTRSGFLHVDRKMCALRAISSDGVGAAPDAPIDRLVIIAPI
jgi:hypothetical protein